MKRVLSIVLLILLLVTGCTNTEQNDTSMTEAPKETTPMEPIPEDLMLRGTSLPIPMGMDYAEDQVVLGECVYSFYNGETPILGFTKRNGETGVLSLPDPCPYIYSICTSSDHLSVLVGEKPQAQKEEAERLEQPVPFSILTYDMDNTLSGTTVLEQTEKQDFYAMTCFDDVSVFMGSSTLVSFDGTGKELASRSLEDQYYRQILRQGETLIVCSGDAKTPWKELQVLDPRTLETMETLPTDGYVFHGVGTDLQGSLLLNCNDRLWRYENGTWRTVFGWLENAKTAHQTYRNITEIPGGYWALGSGETGITFFRKADPNATQTELTLGVVSSEARYERLVNEFNKQSEDYVMIPVEYETQDDWNRAAAELTTGKGCDIYAFGTDYAFSDIQNSAVFEDLLPWMEADEACSPDTLLPGLQTAMSMEGGLYRMPYCMFLETFTMESSLTTESGLTMREMTELAEQNHYPSVFPVWIEQWQIVKHFVDRVIYGYVDWENGVPYFDDPDFILLLDALAKREITMPEYDVRSSWGLLQYNMEQNIGTLKTANVYRTNETYCGFPCLFTNGNLYQVRLQFAMNRSSEQKAGVWEFLRFILSDPMQKLCLRENLPVTQNMMDQILDEAEGEKGGISAEFRQKIERVLAETTTAEGTGTVLRKIVEEEVQACVDGMQTAEQAAENLQARAELYFDERLVQRP